MQKFTICGQPFDKFPPLRSLTEISMTKPAQLAGIGVRRQHFMRGINSGIKQPAIGIVNKNQSRSHVMAKPATGFCFVSGFGKTCVANGRNNVIDSVVYHVTIATLVFGNIQSVVRALNQEIKIRFPGKTGDTGADRHVG